MVIISYPCRGWLVPSPHFRPCSDQISSPSLPPCALENSEYFCLNYNRCCREKPFPILLHHTYKLSFRDKVNLKLCIPSSMGLQEQSCSVRLRPHRGLSPDLEARSSRQRRGRVSPSAAEGGICFGPSSWHVDSLPSPCPRAAFPLCCLQPGVPFLGVALD